MFRSRFVLALLVVLAWACGGPAPDAHETAQQPRPNIVLVMADDMGWGETSYYDHPVLKTPNLDAMAASGLRLDRFYAGAPNCSPTRSTVMTGRNNDRVGVFDHGFPLRLQERTVAQALRDAGYSTAHFGKWHLNGLQGPGVPVLASDERNPGAFGFTNWLSVTNFFDIDPLMSREGEFEQFQGDSSEIVVDEAVQYIRAHQVDDAPFFAVIWYGSPHSPFLASERDRDPFANLEEASANHYGELVAMDRSIGTLRTALRELGLTENTLLWFNSDNGGLPGVTPETVGGLRGFKNSVYEGGLRVPAVIEWPAHIKPRITEHPAGTVDIFPTIADVVGLDKAVMIEPLDGVSLTPLFEGEIGPREKPLGFSHRGRAALIDNDWKILTQDVEKGEYEVYNLRDDPKEEKDLSATATEEAAGLRTALDTFVASVAQSREGQDYPEGHVDPNHPTRRGWHEIEGYKPYFEEWRKVPAFADWIERNVPK
ncbi:MAG: sulfatase-like hydrolase/transferase [Bryobacterales bacterium]|nr:sulfatase-like hydrolase/transferase [Bryobacterales bacterium]